VTARSARQVDEAVIAALRAFPAGEAARAAEVRAALGCTAAELKASRERLQYQGKLLWGRLELAPSMREGQADDRAAVTAADREKAPDPRPLHEPEPAPARTRSAPPPAIPNSAATEAAVPSGRRHQARKAEEPERFDPPLSVPELIQTGLAATPADLVRAVNRRHPEMWRRAVRLGRAHGVLPSIALYDALDRGLTALEQLPAEVPA
jgi:hypothetical protein